MAAICDMAYAHVQSCCKVTLCGTYMLCMRTACTVQSFRVQNKEKNFDRQF